MLHSQSYPTWKTVNNTTVSTLTTQGWLMDTSASTCTWSCYKDRIMMMSMFLRSHPHLQFTTPLKHLSLVGLVILDILQIKFFITSSTPTLNHCHYHLLSQSHVYHVLVMKIIGLHLVSLLFIVHLP